MLVALLLVYTFPGRLSARMSPAVLKSLASSQDRVLDWSLSDKGEAWRLGRSKIW